MIRTTSTTIYKRHSITTSDNTVNEKGKTIMEMESHIDMSENDHLDNESDLGVEARVKKCEWKVKGNTDEITKGMLRVFRSAHYHRDYGK